MTWSVSHTQEALQNVYENLHDMEHETLVDMLAEWKIAEKNDYSGYWGENDSQLFEYHVKKFDKFPDDILADSIWEYMTNEEHGMICENGGFDMWGCNYGCDCHMVSFNREEER